MKADSEWGDFLRKRFAANPKWKVVSRDTMLAKFKDYKVEAKTPCHEFQCAFDAGNIFPAEFVLFWSLTNVDDLYAYTLNLVHVPTSQTIWSRVGEARKRQLGTPTAAAEAALAQIADWLGPNQVRTGRREKRGQLTVLDLSAAGSTPSRVMAERVATHLYASRNYDIMGKKEMDELLGALGINKTAFVPTDTAIYTLGRKMELTHLVYSRLLATRDGGLQLQLALYDIANRKKVREWPSPATQDFRKLLQFEAGFFTSLFQLPEYDGGPMPAEPETGIRWTWAGAAASLAAGVACGYMAYASSRDADRAYDRFRDARSRESAQSYRSQVISGDRGALTWGIMGGLGLAATGGFLVFSF